MQDRNIFIITPSLSGGGIEKSTPILIRSLTEILSVKVTWVGINDSVYHGDLPQTTSTSLGRRSKDGFYQTFRVLLRLRKHVQTLSDPLLLVNGEVAELFTAFFVGRPRIICVEHASQPWKMNRALGLVVRLVLKRKHVRWVTVNSQQRQIWPSIQTFVCIPNPVVPTDPSTADSDLGLIHIGRITKEKGVHLACRASVATKITLDIFGDGELSQDLKEEFARETNIKFHGFVEEVWASIGPNRVLLACSYHEGDGRNIAEAIMRRQPILLLDTNDHRRFGLPDENYFTSLDVLIGKLSLHQASSFNEIRPSLELAKAEREKRDPTRVGRLWVDVLLANGRH